MGCGKTMPKQLATKLVTEATKRKADSNSCGGKTPYNSAPACGRGSPPIFPIPLAILGRLLPPVVLFVSGGIITSSRCIIKARFAHSNRNNRTCCRPCSKASSKLPPSSKDDCNLCKKGRKINARCAASISCRRSSLAHDWRATSMARWAHVRRSRSACSRCTWTWFCKSTSGPSGDCSNKS